MNDDWLALGCAILAIMLALVGIVLPEYTEMISFPYGNLTGVPNTFPYGNLTGVPSVFPYGNLTNIPQTFPYNNLTGKPNTFPYGNLTGIPNVDLMHGLCLWLPFDGVALDKSGYRNDGIVYGAVYSAGKFGSALDFSSDYVDLSGYANIIPSGSTGFSVGAYVLGDTWSSPDYWGFTILYEQTTVEGYTKFIFGVTTNGLLKAGYRDSVTGSYITLGFSSGTISINTFHFVAVTVDTVSDFANFYIDGVLSGNNSFSGGSITGSSATRLKAVGSADRSGSGWNGYFDGLIDEVRVYNRVLNQAEITALNSLP